MSLDPFQMSDWDGRGLERVKSAGFSSRHEVLEWASWQALPRLIDADHRVDLALIDGSHSFDNAIVDFYLVDKLLSEGGLLVFDDVGWSAVERVVHYVMINRDYAIVESLVRDKADRRRILEPLKRLGRLLGRTHRTPDESTRCLIEKVNKVSFLVLQKISDPSQEQQFKYF